MRATCHSAGWPVRVAAAAILLASVLPTSAWAAWPVVVAPITSQCIIEAAAYEHVPADALVGLLKVEHGHIGTIHKNDNGTVDVGPMQVNSSHFQELYQLGMAPAALTYNGCANVFAGAYLLAKEFQANPGKVWQAIGSYHSKTKQLNIEYQWKVYKVLTSPGDAMKVLAEANEYDPALLAWLKRQGKAPLRPAQQTSAAGAPLQSAAGQARGDRPN